MSHFSQIPHCSASTCPLHSTEAGVYLSFAVFSSLHVFKPFLLLPSSWLTLWSTFTAHPNEGSICNELHPTWRTLESLKNCTSHTLPFTQLSVARADTNLEFLLMLRNLEFDEILVCVSFIKCAINLIFLMHKLQTVYFVWKV